MGISFFHYVLIDSCHRGCLWVKPDYCSVRSDILVVHLMMSRGHWHAWSVPWGPYCKPWIGTRLVRCEWPMVACNASRRVWYLYLLPQYYPLYRPIISRTPAVKLKYPPTPYPPFPLVSIYSEHEQLPWMFLPSSLAASNTRQRFEMERRRTHLSSPSSSSQPFNNFRCPSSGQARSER